MLKVEEISVLCTNGICGYTFLQEATDATVRELRKLCSENPMFVVVRLCTSEQSVVDFYNQLDLEPEFPLDVLRNLEAEAQEIKKVSPTMQHQNDQFFEEDLCI